MLQSADPSGPPRINPEYLKHSSDLSALVDGLRRLRAIAHAGPFDDYRGAEVWPGSEQTTDQELANHLRETVTTAYTLWAPAKWETASTPSWTTVCAFGGGENLRVVDASIMPDLPGGNTNLPTMMIAEKAADWIREDG